MIESLALKVRKLLQKKTADTRLPIQRTEMK